MFSFHPSDVYWSNDCARRNAAISGVSFTFTRTASLPLSEILPWNGSASLRLWMVIGFFALTEMKTRAIGSSLRVYGVVKSFQRWCAVSDLLASGIQYTSSRIATVTQNVICSTERLMNSGYATPAPSHSYSFRATCSRITSSTAPNTNTTNAGLNCPGMKLMFHISAVPPGTNPSHGLRHRKIAHDEKYVPTHVSTSVSTMNGSVSELIPSCVAADHHTYIRSTMWSMRSAGEPPGTIAMSCSRISDGAGEQRQRVQQQLVPPHPREPVADDQRREPDRVQRRHVVDPSRAVDRSHHAHEDDRRDEERQPVFPRHEGRQPLVAARRRLLNPLLEDLVPISFAHRSISYYSLPTTNY